MRAAWDTVRGNLERGACFYILNCGLVPIAVAEANTQQTFVNVLENYVIKPLRKWKVSTSCLRVCSHNRVDYRSRMMKQESELRNILRNLQQCMQIMQRTKSRSFSKRI